MRASAYQIYTQLIEIDTLGAIAWHDTMQLRATQHAHDAESFQLMFVQL